MSLGSFLMKSSSNVGFNQIPATFTAIRHGHWLRGKPPGVARSLQQRLQEERVEDPEITKRVNIGFPQLRKPRSEEVRERLAHIKAQRANPDLEKKARSNTLLIDLEDVQKEYIKTKAKFDMKAIADHYGVFSDLFGTAYFVPRVHLNINYKASPVYSGNIIQPADAQQAPDVSFDGTIDPIKGKKTEEVSYWTLIATNPDAHFKQHDAEYVHWFVANIPNGDVKQGEVLVNYLQPFPPKGIGYQRFIFVLYKQNSKQDFSQYKLAESDYANLEKRTFKTLDFYRQFQDEITPAGLAFYQTNWDKSLTDFYHDVLKIKEPRYEYDFPEPYLADQKFFPLRQPFNIYMDKHRDVKEVNKRFVEEKLKNTDPFTGPPPPLRFPSAHPIRNVPSWMATEIRKKNLRMGRWADFS